MFVLIGSSYTLAFQFKQNICIRHDHKMRTPPNIINGAPHTIQAYYWHDSSILILTAKKELALKKKKHIIFGNRSPTKSGEDTISKNISISDLHKV